MSSARQRKANPVWYHFYVESKKKRKKEKVTLIVEKWLPGGGGRGNQERLVEVRNFEL